MNYGVTTNEDSEKQAVSSDSQAVDSAENEKQWQEYFEYCKKYYEQQQQQNTDNKDGDSKETKDVTALAESDPSSYYYYYYYYQYYQQQQQQHEQQPQNNVNTDSSEEANAVHVQEQTENSNQQEQQRSTSQTSDKAEANVITPNKRKSEDAGSYFPLLLFVRFVGLARIIVIGKSFGHFFSSFTKTGSTANLEMGEIKKLKNDSRVFFSLYKKNTLARQCINSAH